MSERLTDAEIARSIVSAAAIFSTGCGNTQPVNEPPENCVDCVSEFLRQVRRLCDGIGPDVPAPPLTGRE